MAGPWDDYRQSSSPASGPWSEYGSKPDAAPSTEQNTSLAGDLGTDLKRGVQKLPGIATGLADIPVAALTNKRFVDETADKLGEVTGFQPSKWSEEARDEYSPERQAGSAEIDQAWEDGSAMDVAGAYASNPGNVAGLVAESLPQMLAGGVVGRGALAAGRATGVIGAPTTAAQAATQGAIAGGVGEGAVIAGGTMDQISDEVEPRRAAAAAAGAGVAGAALSVLGAKAAQRMGVLDAESLIAGGAGQVAGEAPGLARRVAGGALTEGVLEELPQSAAETVIQNWAEEKDLTEGLARAAVEGTLAGSAIGAGVNVLPRKRSEEMGLDPNAGPLSAAAVTAVDSEQALLPGPERLALPAPDPTLYADDQGNVSDQGPARDVDREQRPVPGREQPVRDFGPGMDQQVERGTVPVAGELMPAAQPDAPVQDSAEPRTFDAQPERQGIPDMRESSINVDAEGNAVPGKIPTPRPADYVQGGRGMDQQAPVGKTYSNVLAAKNAIQRAGSADVLEAVQVGPKQFEVRAIAPPAVSQEAPVVEPEPVQPPVADAVSDAPDVAPAAPAATPATKPAPVKPAPQPVDRKGLPEILRHPKKMVITRMAKAAGIKKGSPGYDAAVGRLESEYERQVDDAQAALPFEQFNALNKESPEGVNRQAWTQLRKERGIETADAPAAPKVKPIKGADIDGDWASFSKDSGTISVPRAEMPQIKAEHRGAMVNFLNARGVAHAEETIAADQLKPTQAEYSAKKVEAAKAFEGGDRSILISSDGHVLDGHHQWLAKREAGGEVKVIRLDAPIRQLLDTVAEFPSATTNDAMAENAPQYSRQSYRQGNAGDGSRAVQLRMQLQRLTGGWQNAPDIKVVQSIKDLPDAQRRQVERDGAFDVEGMFADGQVYLVADNLRDVKHAAFVLQHEVLGHAGLQGAYGKRLTPLLMSIYNSNAELKRQADALVQRFGYQPAVAMEEVLADMAAAGTIQDQAFWPRMLTAMRNALRSIGLQVNWSDGDIQGLLANARGYIVNGRRRPGARDAFSRDGRSGRGQEIADEQGRLLSPNGKPSKLNQRQWHQVRGDNFKRWFGNWQGVATENRLDAMKPVRVKVPEDWRGLSVEGMQSKLKERLDLMVKSREVFDHPELGMIRIGRKGKEKTVSTSRDPAKMLAANALDTLLARSIYGVTDPSNEQGVMGYHRLYVPVEMDDHQAVAIFTVRQQNDGEWYYNAVAVEDGNKKRPGSYESPGAPKRPLGETPITGLGDFVRRPFSRVNPDTVSKVLDANGEPLVLYHGTAEEFSVFEQSRAGRSTGHTTAPLGIFVTSDASLAKAYAEKATDGMPGLANVMPLFASIKKPYRMSIAESQTLDTTDKAIAFRQKLEGEGYDGIQLVGSPTWIAFYNNQVKSATNNTGAFDEVDPDIRYRRSGQATLDTIEGLAGRIDTGRTADAFPELSQEARDFLNKVGTQPVVKRASEWVRERTERAATKIRQGIVDRYAALKELDEKLLGKDFIDNAIHNSSWVLARMSSAASGAMNAMLTTGRLRFDAKERVITLQDGDSSGGLAAVLSQLGPAAEVERFMGWIAANRADKLMSEGRENLFTADEIASGKQLNAGRTADGKARTMLYAKAFKEFQQYRDDVLSIAEATGVISAESRAMWRDEFYVPFYRVMNEDATAGGPQASKGLSRQEAYKKLKGGKQNLNDLLENTLMNFHHLLSASLKNQAAAQTMTNAEKMGVARVVPESRRDPKTSTFVLEKGERVFYEIEDPMVFEALTALADPGLNNLAVQTMSAFKRLFTNMTTVTPQFILANTMRDLMQASATSPTSKNLFKNTVQGLAGYRDAKTRAEMQASGGAFSFGHLYGADVNEVKASLNRTVKGAQLITDPSMIPKILRAGWRKWGDVADTAENISRAATYLQNVEEKGRLRAAYEARDIMDFSQHGGWPAVRFLIRVVPFLNARLQGLDKLYRSGVKPALLTAMGQGTASDKEAAARFATVTGALTVASIALYLANADDEEYRKLEDWQKDSYWFFRIGDNAFFLPKPFEVGAIATMAERLTEQLVDDKATGKLFADRLKDMMTQTFSFSPVPQMFQPVLDIYSNTDAFTGRDIESMGMERLSKGLRSRENTTVAGEAVSAVSRALGDESPIALSPVQADHLIRGYFGTVGGNAAGIIDTIWRGATGKESPDKAWSEYQPIRRFYRDLGAPAPYSRYSTLFYDGLREANRVYADVRELQGLGRTAEAQDVGAENRNILAMRLRLNQQQRRVSNINKQMEIVKRSDNDGAWKRRELDRLTLMRNQITEQLGKQVEGVRAE